MRRIVLEVVFALLGLLSIGYFQVAQAVTNTYSCIWTGAACALKAPADCDYASGYIPGGSCVSLNSADCPTAGPFPCVLHTSLPTSTPAPKQCSANNIQTGQQAIIGIIYGSAFGGKSICVEVYKDGKYPPVYSSIYGDEVLLGTVGGEAATRTPAISEAGVYRVFTGFKYGLMLGCNRLYARDPSEYSDICDSTFQATAPGTTPLPSASTLTPYDPTCNTIDKFGIVREGVKSALGCLPVDPQSFLNTTTPWAIGIGAGVAFLLGLYGALMIVISAGNPEKMQAGRELITSAISGLILIIFAVLILKTIGVDILKLF